MKVYTCLLYILGGKKKPLKAPKKDKGEMDEVSKLPMLELYFTKICDGVSLGFPTRGLT